MCPCFAMQSSANLANGLSFSLSASFPASSTDGLSRPPLPRPRPNPITVSTSAPIAPPMEDMVETNQTTLRISLTKWREAGCPILFYVVRYKPRDFIGDWIVYSNHIPTEQQVSST